ncbi:hypothetical protein BDV95DRAFT_607973 [Massariosphaeria phaeospora]|uniref:Beta/gamma crystallin 'Greek key' domain-containing protein n=1 Tax=Massariosphaeria phaeospora TaxID=100035 RepID=A0A7C8M7J1_9PLEO|nr:hypothetical protein BDV95DRAFT_607973 [Massariosphaeria phaeospora]
MRTTVLLAALLGSALSAAVPLTTDLSARADEMTTTSSTCGTTLFKRQYLAGESFAIAAVGQCFDLDQGFGGNWDMQVHSLRVDKGVVCTFYREKNCPPIADYYTDSFVVGDKKKKVEHKTLCQEFDGKIRSVICKKV